MEVRGFFDLFFGFLGSLTYEISGVGFTMYGYEVRLSYILVVLIILSMFVAVFWKGAKG